MTEQTKQAIDVLEDHAKEYRNSICEEAPDDWNERNSIEADAFDHAIAVLKNPLASMPRIKARDIEHPGWYISLPDLALENITIAKLGETTEIYLDRGNHRTIAKPDDEFVGPFSRDKWFVGYDPGCEEQKEERVAFLGQTILDGKQKQFAEKLGVKINTHPTTPSITCPTCKRTSYNPTDIHRKYCGHCHKFHEDM